MLGVPRRSLVRRAFSVGLDHLAEFRKGSELMHSGAFSTAFEQFARCCEILSSTTDIASHDIQLTYEKAVEAAFRAGLHEKGEKMFSGYVDVLRKKNSFIPLYKAYLRQVRCLQTYDLAKAARLCRALLSEGEADYIPVEQYHHLLLEMGVS